MKAVFTRVCAIALVATLAGCATEIGPAGVDVTRFHLGQPIARGQIAVEAFEQGDSTGPEFRTYAASVERQLGRLGWTVVPAGQSEQVALIGVEQQMGEAPPRRAPLSIGIGGGTGGGGRHGGGVGVGGGFSFPVGGGGGPRHIVSTTLQVRIKRRSDGTVFWEGRATTVTPLNQPEAQAGAAVEKLADALFQDFPGESGRTIRVK
jgi:hypothetical protein